MLTKLKILSHMHILSIMSWAKCSTVTVKKFFGQVDKRYAFKTARCYVVFNGF